MSYGTRVDDTQKPSEAVIEVVAEADGVDPSDLEPVLYDVIDPGALNELFSEGNAPYAKVSFRYRGYEVTVSGDGKVTLEDSDRSGTASF